MLEELEAELQGLAEGYRARNADQLHDLLRRVGDLTTSEATMRCEGEAEDWLGQLVEERRAVAVRVAGQERFIAVEDAARYRDGLGVVPPLGLPDVFLEPVEDALESLIRRWARTHGPFVTAALAVRFGLVQSALEPLLITLVERGRLVRGELRPTGVEREWCDADVLRRLQRRTLARLRNEISPVDACVLARFQSEWHGVGTKRSGVGQLTTAIEQLEGMALPWSELVERILPSRVAGFQPRMLDELGSSGSVVWIGRGALGSRDGRVSLLRRERVPLLLPNQPPFEPQSALHGSILTHLEQRGASFTVELQAMLGCRLEEVHEALWDLVWDGRITNDTFAPLTGLAGGRRSRRARTQSIGGRWSAVSQLLLKRPVDTDRAYALTLALLERYGVLSRDALRSEEIPGGFASIYPVLRAMEESGRVRRGWFVDGLTGAQFAVPGAVDRLRGCRETESKKALVLPAVDPANPYGSILPWPKQGGEGAAGVPSPTRPARARGQQTENTSKTDDIPSQSTRKSPRRVAGASVVIVEGYPVLFVEKGEKSVLSFTDDEQDLTEAIHGIVEMVRARRRRRLRLERIDGEPARDSALATLFLQAGFVTDYKLLVLELY